MVGNQRKSGGSTKKKAGMARRKQKQSWQLPTLSAWAMLLIGLFSGSTLTALYFGTQANNTSGIGSGLKWWLEKQQIENRETKTDNEKQTKPIPAPKFDFYHILETERVIPDASFVEDSRETVTRDAAEYVLQVASYKTGEHAERLRAKLALAGLEARVQKFQLADGRIVYRVVLGPFKDKRQLKNVRQKVTKLGLDAIALRSK